MEIKKYKAEISARFNSNGDKEYMFFVNRLQNDQKLAKCTDASLVSICYQIADLGLSLNPAADYIYIIPYGNTATLQLSYKGLLALVKQANPDLIIFANIVFEGDQFSQKITTANPNLVDLEHIPGSNYGDISKIIGAYVLMKEGINMPYTVAYMNLQQLQKARQQSKAPNSPAWINFPDEMYKKVVLRRAMKNLSKIPELPNDEIIEKTTISADKFDDFIEIPKLEKTEKNAE